MNELYLQAPSPEELAATYRGMTFDEFKQLDDEAIVALRVQEKEEWEANAPYDFSLSEPSPEWAKAYNQVQLFYTFCKWRKHGVPDRDMTLEEFQTRERDYFTARVAIDPTYGQIDDAYMPENENLTDAEWQAATLALDDVDAYGNIQPLIRVGGSFDDALKHLNVSYEDLVKKGVLERYTVPPSIIFKESTGYVLAGRWAAYVFARYYIEPDSE